MDNNLEFATLDELIEELLNRFDHAVFCGFQITREHADGTGDTQIHRRWKGNAHTCTGLCADLTNHILDDFEERNYTGEVEDLD